MNKICQDVFNNISNYLSIIDIAKLKQTNKLLRFFVINFEGIYLTNQLKAIDNDSNIIEKKRYFYNYFKYIISNFSVNKYLFQNEILNNMILNIYNSQITKNYQNILNIIIIQCFINIIYFPDNIQIESSFNFLKNFNKGNSFLKFQDIIINYYTYILNSIHNDKIIYNKFRIIYDISPHIINIYSLKKIFSYRLLDLSNTRLLFCCNLEHCIDDNINNICNTKYAYYNDDLISHNYIEVKTFLYKNCIEYYNILIERENYLLNEKLFIKNPNSNRRMRVNGKRWMHYISNLEKTDRDEFIIDVLKQQDRLRSKIFGKFMINN
jgi:hypothetical protein